MKKIAFFDIDGTLTSEKSGAIPDSAVMAIREARAKGNLMFINTGRCLQNVEKRFREIGFDGYVCGCGTNIYYNEEELLHVAQTHDVTMQILEQARKTDVDIIFESKKEIVFDFSRKLHNPEALKLYYGFKAMHYDLSQDPEADDYCCDKFVIWFKKDEQLAEFRKVSDLYFDCIERGGDFREFEPHSYSKATGIQFLLDYFHIPKENAYAFGDSNNDLPMLTFVPNSVAMGNAEPKSLFDKVSYVTEKASKGGIKQALEYFSFY